MSTIKTPYDEELQKLTDAYLLNNEEDQWQRSWLAGAAAGYRCGVAETEVRYKALVESLKALQEAVRRLPSTIPDDIRHAIYIDHHEPSQSFIVTIGTLRAINAALAKLQETPDA